MRSLLSVALLLLAAPAVAQVPGLPAEAPKAEVRFVVADTDTQRFHDAEAPKGVPLVAGEAVQVVTEHKGMVRVFVKGGFGWVPKAGLTTEPPAVPAPGGLPPLLPPG